MPAAGSSSDTEDEEDDDEEEWRVGERFEGQEQKGGGSGGSGGPSSSSSSSSSSEALQQEQEQQWRLSLWESLFRRRWRRAAAECAELSAAGWRCTYGARHLVDRNWAQGKAVVTTIPGHSGTVTCLRFDAEVMLRRTAAGAGAPSSPPSHWRQQQQQQQQQQQPPPPPPPPSPMSPSGSAGQLLPEGTQRLVTGSDDGSLILWSLAPRTREEQGPYSTIPHGVYGPSMARSIPDGAELMQNHHRQTATAGQGVSKLRTYHGHGGPVWCLDFDGSKLVSGSYDKTIKVWDLMSGRCDGTLRGHEGWVSCLALSADGRRVLSGSWDATLKLWDLDDDGGGNGIGRNVATFAGPAPAGNAIHCLHWDRGAAGCAHGHVGSFAAAGCRHRNVSVWDVAAQRRVVAFAGHVKEVYAVQIAPGSDGGARRSVVSASGDGTVKLWDTATGRCEQTLAHHVGAVMCVQYDGEHRVLSGGYDKRVLVYDLRYPSNALCCSLEAHSAAVFALQFDDNKVVSGGIDGIKLFRFNDTTRYV